MTQGELEQALHRLQARVERLEYREGYLRQLADGTGNERIAYFVLERNLNQRQVVGITHMLDKMHEALTKDGAKITADQFESRVSEFCPEGERDKLYDFAKSVLISFCSNGQWSDLYDRMRRAGMNLPDPENIG